MTAKLTLVAQKHPPDLGRLAKMGPIELQNLYREMFGKPVPAGSSELARRKIAWRIQAEREGGLPESARRHALAIARESGVRVRSVRRNPGSPVAHATVTGIVSAHDSRLPMPGSVIVKRHRGQTLVVQVLDSGFEYGGRRFTSLSAIAMEITGTKWNGYSFFGLAKETHGR